MIADADKYLAMVLKSQNYCFEFIVNDFSIPIHNNTTLPGLNIDRKLVCSQHTREICDKVSNQTAVLSQFWRILSLQIRCKPYKPFIILYFRYFSSVWHFCGTQNRDKLELPNIRALRALGNLA